MSDFKIVRKIGGSRIITVSKYLPKEWKAVEVDIVEKHNNTIVLKIEKVK